MALNIFDPKQLLSGIANTGASVLSSLPFLKGGKDVYGAKPIVPKGINYAPALKSTIATNKEILPSLTELGLMSTDALNQLIERLAPGSTALRDTITSGYESLAKGEIPPDVARNIRQQIAESGVAGGTAGSDFNLANLSRTLGLTSLDLSREGRQRGGAWFANLASRAYDPTRGFLTKDDAVRQTEFNWQRDWLAAQVKAAPNPVARGRFNFGVGVAQQALGAFLGTPKSQPQRQSSFGLGQAQQTAESNMGTPEYDLGGDNLSSNALGAEQEAFDWAF